MPHLITLHSNPQNNRIFYNTEDKTFYGNEKDIPFATSYEIKNTMTNTSKIFEFDHSTGPEFDPKTNWIYKGPDGLKLIIVNDPATTKQLAENYLAGKLRK